MSKPEIRFPEFSESWIKSKISEHFVFKNGINKEKEAFGKGTPIINFKDVYNERVLKSENIKGLITISDKEKSAFLVKKGDLFFTRTSETPSDIGMSASLLEDISECIFSGFVLRARPISDDLIPAFNAYRFSTNSVRKEIITKSSFTTRALTSGSLLNEVKFFFPQNKNEQEKIADFLSAVDEKIRLLKEKHALLQKYKKGLMQKLFSQEIRFKDDNGQAFPEWRIEPLGKWFTEYNESSVEENQYEVLTSSRKGLIKQSEYYGEGRITERSNKGFNVIPNGYLTYRSRSDDRQFFFNLNDLGFTGIISTYYPVFTMKNGNNSFFIELSRINRNLFGRYAVGTSQVVLSFNELKKIKLPMPSDAEQRKIEQFAKALDDKVNAVQQQIDLTQTFKKGLLQQMFV